MTDDIGSIVEDQFAKLLEQHVDRAAIQSAELKSMSTPLWEAVEGAGLPLALLPEAEGGIGLDPVAVFKLISTSAYYALPLPLGETIVAGALIGRNIKGPLSLALCENGAASRVPFGADAAHLLCSNEDGWSLVDTSNVEASRGGNLAGEARDDLRFSPDKMEKLDRPHWLGPQGLKAAGALIRAAQMRGAMRRAVDMSLAHSREREQFGRPISKFQAVQHMLADASVQLVAAGALVDNAAEAWGNDDFEFRASLAKSRAGKASGKVAEVAHQVHAAMGFTQDHDLNFYTRRLWSWRDEFGSEAYWQEKIGRDICAESGAALWPRLISATAGAVA